jgi:hypothetical protein
VRDHDWLVKMIQHPEQLLKENDPIATAMLKKYNNVRMPNVSVNNDELDLLLRYLETATAAHNKEANAGANAVATKPADASTGTTHPNR